MIFDISNAKINYYKDFKVAYFCFLLVVIIYYI